MLSMVICSIVAHRQCWSKTGLPISVGNVWNAVQGLKIAIDKPGLAGARQTAMLAEHTVRGQTCSHSTQTNSEATQHSQTDDIVDSRLAVPNGKAAMNRPGLAGARQIATVAPLLCSQQACRQPSKSTKRQSDADVQGENKRHKVRTQFTCYIFSSIQYCFGHSLAQDGHDCHFIAAEHSPRSFASVHHACAQHPMDNLFLCYIRMLDTTSNGTDVCMLQNFDSSYPLP